MTVNVALLRKTLGHIAAHPQAWDQKSFAVQYYKDGHPCGAAFCFAGWAVQLAGHEILSNPHYVPRTCGWDSYESYGCGTPGVGGGKISTVAARELGLDGKQADLLFDEDNTLADLQRIVGQFIAEAA